MKEQIRESIVEKVAREFVDYVLNEDEELVFLDDYGFKEAIRIEAKEMDIELDDETLDEMLDDTEIKFINLIREQGFEVYFPQMTFAFKGKYIRAEVNGLTIVKEA